MCTRTQTPTQLVALWFLIFASRDGSDLAKRLMAFLISQSCGLIHEVCTTLIEGQDGFTKEEIKEAANGFHDMSSYSGGRTHVTQIIRAMGSDFRFDFHYGDFNPVRLGDPFNTDGMFPGWPIEKVGGADENPNLVKEGMPLRYTFWLNKESYSRQATYVAVDADTLNQIDLTKPGLYPRIENQPY